MIDTVRCAVILVPTWRERIRVAPNPPLTSGSPMRSFSQGVRGKVMASACHEQVLQRVEVAEGSFGRAHRTVVDALAMARFARERVRIQLGRLGQ